MKLNARILLLSVLLMFGTLIPESAVACVPGFCHAIGGGTVAFNRAARLANRSRFAVLPIRRAGLRVRARLAANRGFRRAGRQAFRRGFRGF